MAKTNMIPHRRVYDYLGEDVLQHGTAACAGCTQELLLRIAMRVLGEDTIYFGCPGCGGIQLGGNETMVRAHIATCFCLMTTVPSTMTGVKRYLRRIGKATKVVAWVGDGTTADVGFQPLSGAAERGENLIYICCDNEAYMNTGIQRSSTTPFGAWTFTSPAGKDESSKYMPLIMASHGIPYVATATAAYLEDYCQKLTKAMQVEDGMAYIHLLSPCPIGWRTPEDAGIELSRMAVETNYFPLWEAERGRFRLTRNVEKPKAVREFTKLSRRFSNLGEEALDELQKTVDARLATISALCEASKETPLRF